ncbi:uncharacterized protein LOC126731318 [Quercus robur]|uniref:uncharacterized protein LOC126731318 n=1 Tax=Quercus robur TaxID=38942 RepID=UPI00216262E8|nr:uncharacterized protein LOC126731318 [Quercus robur]
MVVKRKEEQGHIGDLIDVFEVLRRHKLHLNANKCSFGVGAGKFLGYLITHRGIEVNPDQISVIERLKSSSNPKEIQVLTGFQWTKECEKAFQDLKEYLVRAPMLSAPEPSKDLFMYLSVSEHTVSAVLVRDQGVQQPVYYISKTLVNADTRYLPLEKLVLELVHATRKLPHYVQAHTVYVLTEYPLQSLLKRSDFTSRIAKWGTRLGYFDIQYRPRISMKGQVLADFIAKFSLKRELETVCHVEVWPWRVFIDDASNALGVGVEIVIIMPKGIRVKHSLRLGFKASNNEAEYKALLAGLRAILNLGAREVEVYFDSWLVINQVEDSLATLASLLTEEVPRLIKVEVVAEPSIDARVNVSTVKVSKPCWMDPIIDFLAQDCVPTNEKEAERLLRVATRYWLSVNCKLYRRSFRRSYLQFLHPSKVNELLTELHEGICSSHVGG